MDTIATPLDLSRAIAAAERLAADDRSAAEALIAAMSGWDATELAEYRTAVLAELAALGDRPVDGFLAVEVAALCAVEVGEPRPVVPA
jgi:hypothetical protein